MAEFNHRYEFPLSFFIATVFAHLSFVCFPFARFQEEMERGNTKQKPFSFWISSGCWFFCYFFCMILFVQTWIKKLCLQNHTIAVCLRWMCRVLLPAAVGYSAMYCTTDLFSGRLLFLGISVLLFSSEFISQIREEERNFGLFDTIKTLALFGLLLLCLVLTDERVVTAIALVLPRVLEDVIPAAYRKLSGSAAPRENHPDQAQILARYGHARSIQTVLARYGHARSIQPLTGTSGSNLLLGDAIQERKWLSNPKNGRKQKVLGI